MGLAHLKHSRVSFSFNMSIALTSQLFLPQMHQWCVLNPLSALTPLKPEQQRGCPEINVRILSHYVCSTGSMRPREPVELLSNTMIFLGVQWAVHITTGGKKCVWLFRVSDFLVKQLKGFLKKVCVATLCGIAYVRHIFTDLHQAYSLSIFFFSLLF